MSEERPEYVSCVGLGYRHERKIESWCGGDDKPYFADPAHAALNGKHEGRLVACPECVKKITEALCNRH